MMQLEEELGVKLFVRSKHSIYLTDEGMLFRRRAKEIVSLMEKTMFELNAEDQISGEITIGSGEILAFSQLAAIITDFGKAYPLVHFDIQSGNADSTKDGIERGLIDIGLVVVPVDIGKYEYLRMPGEETWGAYVHEEHPLAARDFVERDDLAGEKLLITHREIVQNAIAGWFGGGFEKLNIIGTYNLPANAIALVQQKAGIAIGLRRRCTFDNVRFIPFRPALTTKSILIWKKTQTVSPTVSAFVEYAKKYINRIVVDEI